MPYFGAGLRSTGTTPETQQKRCSVPKRENVGICVKKCAARIAKAHLKGENHFMASNDFAMVVLAAGKGTRLKSNVAKVLHRAGGRTLVEHVVHACKGSGARRICVVVGYQSDEVAAVVTPLGAKTVLQQWPQARYPVTPFLSRVAQLATRNM